MATRVSTSPWLTAVALVAGLSACGSGDKGPESVLTNADGVLGFVPADTPYVFATPESMPDAVLDKLEESSDSLYAAYETVLKNSLTEMADELESQGDEEQAELALSLGREIAGLLQSENLRAAGVARGGQAALYGVGLLPVIRIELSNPLAFEAKIAELEADAGGEMSLGEAEGIPYRFIGDDTARVVISVIGDFAVATVVPAGLAEAQVAEVLGIKKPARNIAESGALADLAEGYGFTPYGLGFLSFESLVDAFLDEPTGVNAAWFSMIGYDRSDLSAVCREDIRAFATIMPRAVAGYTSVDTSRLESNAVLELRDDIARGLSAISASVPGLGADHGGLGSFGMSFDVAATRDFLENRFDAYEAEPFECEYFADLQTGIDQARQSMNQPLPPIVYSFKGFLAVIDRIEGLDMTGQQPPRDVDARLVVANENAEALLAMGAMFSPELAALNLEPNGRAVALPLPQLAAGNIQSAFVAMTPGALAVSVGEGPPEALESLLASQAAEPSPTMSLHLDGQRYYQFMNEAVRVGSAGEDGEELPEDVQEALSTVMTGVGDLIERISVDMTFTARGVELPTTVTLADR